MLHGHINRLVTGIHSPRACPTSIPPLLSTRHPTDYGPTTTRYPSPISPSSLGWRKADQCAQARASSFGEPPTPLHLVGSKTNHKPAGNGIDNKGILSRLSELNIRLCIKRDDATGGAELGGNKVRKLEFLLADALAKGCDSVVTIGGEQSNHCRATAAARCVFCSCTCRRRWDLYHSMIRAGKNWCFSKLTCQIHVTSLSNVRVSRMVGLSPHLILRTQRADAINSTTDDMGWTGNILFDWMVGSTIYTCMPGEYGRLGSNTLVNGVCDYIQFSEKSSNHSYPYPIPVGGSNGIGTWGYINAVDKLMNQLEYKCP